MGQLEEMTERFQCAPYLVRRNRPGILPAVQSVQRPASLADLTSNSVDIGKGVLHRHCSNEVAVSASGHDEECEDMHAYIKTFESFKQRLLVF